MIQNLSRFWRKTDGNVSLLFGLSLLPVLASAGVAIDYSRLSGTQTHLQSALDSAILSAVTSAPASQDGVARSMLSANLPANIKLTSQTYTPGTDTLSGQVTAEVSTVFNLFSSSKVQSVSAKATAKMDTASAPPSPVCILILDPASTGTLIANGMLGLKAPDCEIHVKSKGTPSAMFNGFSAPDTKRVCVESSSVMQLMTPVKNLELNCKTADDPFVGKIPKPTKTTCDFNGAFYFGPVTLNPGVYCGTTVFNGTVDVTLNPGLYVIQNGSWIVNGFGKFTGNGVTFYFPDTSNIVFNGNMNNSLTAPTSGPYKGVLFAEADGLPKTVMMYNGQNGNLMEGLIYLPSRYLTFNAAAVSSPNKLTMVVDRLLLNMVNMNLAPNPDMVIPAASVKKKPYLVL